jgi:hypothetical protein
MSLYDKQGWRKKRLRQLTESPLCTFCEKQGKVTAATVADHIEPHRGDAAKFWNNPLQSLCATCHSSVKQREENGSPVPNIGADGFPIDNWHHFNR